MCLKLMMNFLNLCKTLQKMSVCNCKCCLHGGKMTPGAYLLRCLRHFALQSLNPSSPLGQAEAAETLLVLSRPLSLSFSEKSAILNRVGKKET